MGSDRDVSGGHDSVDPAGAVPYGRRVFAFEVAGVQPGSFVGSARKLKTLAHGEVRLRRPDVPAVERAFQHPEGRIGLSAPEIVFSQLVAWLAEIRIDAYRLLERRLGFAEVVILSVQSGEKHSRLNASRTQLNGLVQNLDRSVGVATRVVKSRRVQHHVGFVSVEPVV